MAARTLRPRALQIAAVAVAMAAAVLLWSHLSFAQDEGPPPRMVRVHGLVRDTSGPLPAGRLIRFAPQNTGSPEAVTGPGGSYSMQVDLRRPLWVRIWVDGVARSRFLRLAAPQGVTEIRADLQLAPPIVLTGTITLPDGRPAANMTVKAEGIVWSESGGVAGASGGGFGLPLKTDARGRYRVTLQEGGQATYDVYISQEGAGCLGPVKITTDVDRPNMQRDFHLMPGGVIQGQVIAAPGGTPLRGAVVSASTGSIMHGHAFGRRATTDKEGRFRIGMLPPGRYDLEAGFDEGRKEAVASDPHAGLWAMFAITPDARELEVRDGRSCGFEIQMVKELVVTGRALGPAGAPLPRVALEGLNVTTDDEGRFVYRIRPEREVYGQVYLNRELTLAPKVPGVGVAIPVEVKFADAKPQEVDLHVVQPGTVTGRALYEGTDQPVAGACVELPPHWGPGGEAHSVDDAGRFEIKDVPPGDYQLSIRGLRILGCPTPPVPVTVHSGETVGPLELRFPPRPSLKGHVSGIPEVKTIALPEGGEGGFGLEVAVAPVGRPTDVRVLFTDLHPDDSFTAWMPGPLTGRYDIVLMAGFPSPRLRMVSNVLRDVDLGGGGPAGLQLELHPGGTIGGRVVAADGVTPLPYVGVQARPMKGDALLLARPPEQERDAPGVPETSTDEEGTFTIAGLLPGEYEVSVHWARDCFGYVGPVYVDLAEREERTDLEFRAARDWP